MGRGVGYETKLQGAMLVAGGKGLQRYWGRRKSVRKTKVRVPGRGGRSREGQEECRGSPKQRTHCAAPRQGLVERRKGAWDCVGS